MIIGNKNNARTYTLLYITAVGTFYLFANG